MITFAELQDTEEWQNLALPAQEHYRDDVPYHNWDNHIMFSVAELVALANRCEGRGIRLPVGQLAIAMAWHDVRSFENPKEHHFPNEEARSAHLAREFLIENGKSKTYAADVSKAILGTRAGIPRRNILMLAAHWADVANIGKPYEVFAPNAAKLLEEQRMLKPDLSFADFVLRTRSFIGVLIAESFREFPKLGEPVEGEYSFSAQALANSRALGAEGEAKFVQHGTYA